jgi:hypothetical protein
MSISVAEKFGSPVLTKGNSNQAQLLYVCIADNDETEFEVRTQVESTAPSTYDGLPRTDITLSPVANGVWDAEVNYQSASEQGFSGPPSEGGLVVSFDISGTNQRITQSLQTISSYLAGGGAAPDFKGAIGVNGEEIEGVDVIVPVAQVKYTAFLEDVDQAAIMNLVGSVNDDAYIGRAAGKVLFIGASGQQRSTDGVWEVTFSFAVAENKTGLTVGDITGIAKEGWDYLWVRYKNATDADTLTREPLAAYVERVYPRGDFDALPLFA